MIKLGKMVEDTVTGFRGISVGRLEKLSGVIYIEVQPEMNDVGIVPPPRLINEKYLVAKGQKVKK